MALPSAVGLVLIAVSYFFMNSSNGITFWAGIFLLIIDGFLFVLQFRRNLHIREDGILELSSTETHSFYPPFKITEFWGYGAPSITFMDRKYSGSSGYKKRGSLSTCINILVEDSHGNKVLFYKTLAPWKEAPQDLKYKVIQEPELIRIKVFQFRRILNNLKKYLA